MLDTVKIDGDLYIEGNIVMLSTIRELQQNQLYLDTSINLLGIALILPHKRNTIVPKHLYITSNEEIKDGDWYYCVKLGRIEKAEGEVIKDWWNTIKGEDGTARWFKKIIASTDEMLGLPKPRPEIAHLYMKSYNDNKPFKEVLVEIEYNKLYPMVEFNNVKLKLIENQVFLRICNHSFK